VTHHQLLIPSLQPRLRPGQLGYAHPSPIRRHLCRYQWRSPWATFCRPSGGLCLRAGAGCVGVRGVGVRGVWACRVNAILVAPCTGDR
jgi:hypothetical protein